MQRYRNLSGDSGVVAYEIGRDSIDVKFKDGWTYLYTYASAGPSQIEEMKKLAVAGQGLCKYIVQHVHKSYAAKRQ